MGFVVTVTDGPNAGTAMTVEATRPSRVLVGKSPICDIVLSDPMVSRRHMALEVSDNRLVVTDLDSMNGTFVNDVAVAVAFLEGGEQLRVGSTTLRVAIVPASSAPVAARPFGRLVGESVRMQALYVMCERLAQRDVPIVIEGETGTGKELVAECIHEASARAAGPFVVFDAASTRGASQAVLFGERTTAGYQPGLFELAHGGTLLVDAIDELGLEAQACLLRALERGEFLAIGEREWRKVNVRVLATTSRNLDRLVEEQRFREELFYRLTVSRLELPPLRRREGDVEILARHFFAHLSGGADATDEFLARYAGYEWPGNVRELENAVTLFAAVGGDVAHELSSRRPPPDGRVRPSGSPAVEAPGVPVQVLVDARMTYSEARAHVLDAFTAAWVEHVLALHGGNVTRAAAASGMARRYFQTLRARQKR